MITEQAYRQLKQEVQTAQTDAARAEGALEELMSNLKTEFECTTLKQAEDKLKALVSQLAEAEVAYTQAERTYRKQWKQDSTSQTSEES